jgi:hypothetical protein
VVEGAVTTTLGVEEGEEVDAGEGVVVLQPLTLEGGRGYHFTTGVTEGLESSTVFVEVGVVGTGSGGIELHQEIGNQVEYFGWHL